MIFDLIYCVIYNIGKPGLSGLWLARGKLAIPGPYAHKSIGSNSYRLNERAVLWFPCLNQKIAGRVTVAH
ncbi:MAG: hypothetical protein E3J56_06205 [Candidatus Aminicenantes bacterium]|nr:MAG: hypothetical protein E3J56_06205 [Candidatus Aminicenantes bacterium]